MGTVWTDPNEEHDAVRERTGINKADLDHLTTRDIHKFPCNPSNEFATPSATSSCRQAITTCAPCLMSWRVVSNPTPEFTPVTISVFLLISFDSVASSQ
ncbi:MAG: hypothetical protein OXF95_11645 [Rhodobacteraceae bacterium]|nr:hypothetical protein [Paracoccaceae bacterium]